MGIKISEKDLEQLSQDPLELFYQGIKADETREKYSRTLKRVLCDYLGDILQGTFEQRVNQVVKKAKKDPDWGLMVLLTLSKKQKERTKLNPSDPNYLNPTSFDNTFKPLKKLFDMNDIPIVWKKVYATFPENNNASATFTRGYTRDEIQKMLRFANGPMDRCIILAAASSGCRLGQLIFNWDDIFPVYKVDDKIVLEITESEAERADVVCVMIKTYRGSDYEIPIFCTEEFYQALMDWKKVWTREVGREPKAGEPVFKQSGPFVKSASTFAIKQRIERILKASGILPPLVKGKRRREVPGMNGFRRFFNKVNKETVSRDSPLAALIKKEYMMSHTGLTSLDRNYFKTHIIELIEEYLSVSEALAISPEARQRATILQLRKDKSKLESEKQDEVVRLRTELKDLREQVEKVTVGYEIQKRVKDKDVK